MRFSYSCKYLIWIISALSTSLVLNSCVALIGSQKTDVTFSSNVPLELVLNFDTFAVSSVQKTYRLERNQSRLYPKTIYSTDTSLFSIQSKLHYGLIVDAFVPPLGILTPLIEYALNPYIYSYPTNLHFEYTDSAMALYKYHKPTYAKPYRIYKSDMLYLVNALTHPFATLGVEMPIHERLFGEITIGSALPDYPIRISTFLNNQREAMRIPRNANGVMAQIALKRYNLLGAPIGPFWSLDLGYVQYAFDLNTSIYDPTASLNFSDTLRYTHRSVRLSLHRGHQFHFENRVFLSPSVGIMVNFTHGSVKNRLYAKRDDLYEYLDFSQDLNKNRAGRYTQVLFPLRLTLGVRF